MERLIQWVWGGPVVCMFHKTPGEALALTLRRDPLAQESELRVPQRWEVTAISTLTAQTGRRREGKGLLRVTL